MFITGASGGIGQATVEKFVKEGWGVAGFYSGNKIEDQEYCRYWQMDITDPASIEKAFGEAFSIWGKVDGQINIAGISLGLKLSQHTGDTIEKETDINFKGTVLCVKEILKYMTEGVVVNIGSVSMYGMGPTLDPVYSGTKAAVWGFSKQMAKELAPKIRVNVVAPGLCGTELARKTHSAEDMDNIARATPLGKIATPQDIANGIYFLASEQASHITGACLDINGGFYLR